MEKLTPGHKHLRAWFRRRPWLVRTHEAEAMGMSKQQLGHILAGRRQPTLLQAIAINTHTGIDLGLWEWRQK